MPSPVWIDKRQTYYDNDDNRERERVYVYCKTLIVSVPLNLAFLASGLLALNIAYAKTTSKSDDWALLNTDTANINLRLLNIGLCFGRYV